MQTKEAGDAFKHRLFFGNHFDSRSATVFRCPLIGSLADHDQMREGRSQGIVLAEKLAHQRFANLEYRRRAFRDHCRTARRSRE